MTVLYNKADGALLYTSSVQLPDGIEVGALNVTMPEGKVFSGININKGKATAIFADIPIDPRVAELEQKLEVTQLAVAELIETMAGKE